MHRLLLFPLLSFSLSLFSQQVTVTGAMKDVMWKGKTQAVVHTDTFPQAHLYGLGPMAGLRGEVMIWDGMTFISQISGPGELRVVAADTASLPFFAYAHIPRWQKADLPDSVMDLASLESYLFSLPGSSDSPFLFTLTGKVRSGTIHCVNLPEGAVVRNPDEAHQGRQSFSFRKKEVLVLGFFSTRHKAIFTHHDTFLHLHLITADRSLMGHVDALSWKKGLKFYLPNVK